MSWSLRAKLQDFMVSIRVEGHRSMIMKPSAWGVRQLSLVRRARPLGHHMLALLERGRDILSLSKVNDSENMVSNALD